MQRKTDKDQTDAQLKAAQIETERMRIQSRMEMDGARLGAQIAKDQMEQEFKEGVETVRNEIEGTRIGADIARNIAAMQQQRESVTKKAVGESKE